MVVSKWIARQLGRPTGILGWFAGQVWNRRNAALNDTLLERLALQPTDRVLEVGFGGGYLLQRMAAQVTDGRLAGVDISPAIVAAAQNRFRRAIQAGQIELRCAPVEALPLSCSDLHKGIQRQFHLLLARFAPGDKRDAPCIGRWWPVGPVFHLQSLAGAQGLCPKYPSLRRR